MNAFLVKQITVVNEGKEFVSDVLIKDGIIARIDPHIEDKKKKYIEINGEDLHLFPGVIDNHVHFREPGYTEKATIASESKAAVAGGVTSFMEMPNTKPLATSFEEVEKKLNLAKNASLANYSFYIGASNDNLEDLKSADYSRIPAIKIFMGSSTGNMLVDDYDVLTEIFSSCPKLIAVHAEEEGIIKQNIETFTKKYGNNIPLSAHPLIRSVKACVKSTKKAIDLAKKNRAKLHVLHLTTADEVPFFTNDDINHKSVTTEVCVHHLLFDSDDYLLLGNKIKCNPAIKSKKHKKALLQGLKDNRIDIVCSDHAPHLASEKAQNYTKAPAGIPMVQHTLPNMLEFYHQGELGLTDIVQKMCHAPAEIYQVKNRGYLREGFAADCVIVDLQAYYTVNPNNIYYKCGWSPFENRPLKSEITHTFVNGNLVYEKGVFNEDARGEELAFL